MKPEEPKAWLKFLSEMVPDQKTLDKIQEFLGKALANTKTYTPETRSLNPEN